MNNLPTEFTQSDPLSMVQGAGITFVLTVVSGLAGLAQSLGSSSVACRVIGVTDHGLRAWEHRPQSHRLRRDRVLLAHIRNQHRLSPGSHGRQKMTEELNELGLRVGHRRVGRLMRQTAIAGVRPHEFTVEEGQEMIRGIISPTRDRQRPDSQHRAEALVAAFRREPDEPEVGGRHPLCLDAGGLDPSGGHSGPALPASDRIGHQQPHEDGPGDPRPEPGHRPAQAPKGLQSPHGSCKPILFARLSENLEKT